MIVFASLISSVIWN